MTRATTSRQSLPWYHNPMISQVSTRINAVFPSAHVISFYNLLQFLESLDCLRESFDCQKCWILHECCTVQNSFISVMHATSSTKENKSKTCSDHGLAEAKKETEFQCEYSRSRQNDLILFALSQLTHHPEQSPLCSMYSWSYQSW